MMSIGTVLKAVNAHRIVCMKSSPGDDSPYAWGEWTKKMTTEDDPALEQYCADVENAVETLYSDPTPGVTDHEIALANSAVEGISRVHVRWDDKARTMALVRLFLADMRRAVRESFHPEIDEERQRWVGAEKAKQAPGELYQYDKEIDAALRASDNVQDIPAFSG